MLRLNGPDVYDQWVKHKIPFNDPKVKAVADAVGAYVKNPDYIGGDNMVKAIATTKFQDGGLPILSGDCYMHRQASFYSTLWPDGTKIGPDGDIWFFYLPSQGWRPEVHARRRRHHTPRAPTSPRRRRRPLHRFRRVPADDRRTVAHEPVAEQEHRHFQRSPIRSSRRSPTCRRAPTSSASTPPT